MIEASSQDLVSRVTGLSRRQLDYWDRTDVISPSVAPFEGRGYQRLYSFRDLIKLKVAAAMRQRGIRPSRIRLAIHELEARGFADPFVTLTFAVQPDGKEILYADPSLDKPLSVRHVDQIAEPMDIPLRDIKTGLEATIAELTRRPTGQIAQVRNLVGREPVVAGTRVPTEKVAGLVQRGWSADRIVAAHPHLTEADVKAALEYERKRTTRRRSA